ncbi:MAG: 6-phosphogluconolactonase, partial [Planctomycetota bacterium]
SESEDLANAAAGYERDLLKLTTPPGAVDLVVLGMGDDGHTASLFPGQPEPDGLIAAARATAGTVADGRITFTFQALEKAHMVMILVSGAKKAERLREVLNEQGDLPMQRVLRSRKGTTVLIADRDALARIEATQIEALS